MPNVISREQLIADESTNGYLYLGRQHLSSEVVFSNRPAVSGNRLALVDNRNEDILLRGIFAIDSTWCNFTPDGNIGGLSQGYKAKATCYLKEVPKKSKNYKYAREDFHTACTNLRAIMDKVAGPPVERNKSLVQAVGEAPQHDAIKLSHSLFQRLPAPDEECDEEGDKDADNASDTEVSPYDFDNWPISDANRRKLELVEQTRKWKIVPIPVFRRVDGEWKLLSPSDYMSTLPGCIVDVSFVVANWNISKNGTVDRSFNAIPACIRILAVGKHSPGCSPETTKRARDAMLTSDAAKEPRLEGSDAATDSRTHPVDEVTNNTDNGAVDTIGEAQRGASAAAASSNSNRKRNKRV